MTTAEQIALWALIVAGATLLTYLGQLLVLILVYRRVIKETDRNAEERQRTINDVGEKWQAMGKNLEQRLLKMNRRNTIALSVMGICIAILLFVNRSIAYKIDKRTRELEKLDAKRNRPSTS